MILFFHYSTKFCFSNNLFPAYCSYNLPKALKEQLSQEISADLVVLWFNFPHCCSDVDMYSRVCPYIMRELMDVVTGKTDDTSD